MCHLAMRLIYVCWIQNIAKWNKYISENPLNLTDLTKLTKQQTPAGQPFSVFHQDNALSINPAIQGYKNKTIKMHEKVVTDAESVG